MPGVALVTFCAIRTANIAKIKICAVRQPDIQLPVIDRDTFDADAVFAVRAVLSILAVSAIFTVLSGIALVALSSDDRAKVFDRAVRIGQHQLAQPIDLGSFHAIAVLAVLPVAAPVAFGADHAANVGALSVGKHQYQFPVAIDLGRGHADAVGTVLPILAVGAVLSVLSGIALVTFRTVLAVFSDDSAKVRRAAVGGGDQQFPGRVDLGFGYADAVFPVRTVFAVFTVGAVFTVLPGIAFFALSPDHAADVGALPVGKRQHQFPVAVDLGPGHTDAVRAVCPDDLIQIDAFAVRKGHHQMPIPIDHGGGDAHPVGAILSIGTYGFAEVQAAAVGKDKDQIARCGKRRALDAYRRRGRAGRHRGGKVLFRAGIAAVLGQFIGRLPLQRGKPLLHRAGVAVGFG